MAGNSFGQLFRLTTFGESHGRAIGVVVDGVPPGLELTGRDIQAQLDRRRPGQSDVTTPRGEADEVEILSGVFEGRTTGTALAMVIFNRQADPSAYEAIRDRFRPGHADYTYFQKYGLRDWRGGGRSSGRETAARVAAGAVALKLLARRGVTVQAWTHRAAGIECATFDPAVIEANAMRAPDAGAGERMAQAVREAAARGDSVGGIVRCRVSGLPAGLGEPVFDKLDAELAKAMLSLGAVKGVEFGAGFAAADMTGSTHNDALLPLPGRPGQALFQTNHAGGVLGGISTGAELVFAVAVKPTASIALPQQTIDTAGRAVTIATRGRHDPCICPRLVPVVEAMTAVVLEDHFQRQAALGR